MLKVYSDVINICPISMGFTYTVLGGHKKLLFWLLQWISRLFLESHAYFLISGYLILNFNLRWDETVVLVISLFIEYEN